jgi:hypothetical protein
MNIIYMYSHTNGEAELGEISQVFLFTALQAHTGNPEVIP